MRPLLVVSVSVVFDHDAGLGQGPELLAVEALIPEAPVEGFHETILPGAPRLDVDGLDLVLGQPVLDLFSDKLRAIVGANVLRDAVLGDGALHKVDDVAGLEGPVRPEHMALPGVLIEDREHPQGAASYRGVGDKVPGPHLVLMRCLGRKSGGVAPGAGPSAWLVALSGLPAGAGAAPGACPRSSPPV